MACRPHCNYSLLCSHLIYQQHLTVHWGWNWALLRKDKALGLTDKNKNFHLFFLKFQVLTFASLWKLSWGWSSRRCIFNEFGLLGPCLTPSPPFSPRYWFNMMSALHSKAHELAESRSSREELVRTPIFIFSRKGCKYELCIMAFLGLNTRKNPLSSWRVKRSNTSALFGKHPAPKTVMG